MTFRSAGWRLAGMVLGCAALGGLALLFVLGQQSQVELRHPTQAAAFEELDAVRSRYPGGPLLQLEERDGRMVARAAVPARVAGAAAATHVAALLWVPAEGRLYEASMPRWAWDLMRWKLSFGRPLVDPLLAQVGIELEPPDLSGAGPGLLLDHAFADGRQLVAWLDDAEPAPR